MQLVTMRELGTPSLTFPTRELQATHTHIEWGREER